MSIEGTNLEPVVLKDIMSEIEHVSVIVDHVMHHPWDVEYRPTRWESPIERMLYETIAGTGLSVESQVPAGQFRLDIVVSSRLSPMTLAVECDGANYHNIVVDDFRDDILEDDGWNLCRISGSSITRSADGCAYKIIEKWFPEHTSTIGFVELREDLKKNWGDKLVHSLPPFIRYRPQAYGEGSGAFAARAQRDTIRKLFGNRGSLIDYARAYIKAYMAFPEGFLNQLHETYNK